MWGWSLVTFLLLMIYIYYLASSFENHNQSKQRLMLFLVLPLVLVVYHYIHYSSSVVITANWVDTVKTLAQPLLHWTFLIPMLIAVLLMTYATYSQKEVTIGMNIFGSDTSGKLSTSEPSSSQFMAFVNISMVLTGFLVILFALTILVTIMQFQRNQLGLFTNFLLYLPCLMADWIAAFLQVSRLSSTGENGLFAQGATPVILVASILLVFSALGFRKSLNTQRTLEEIRDKTTQLLNLDPSTFGPERRERLQIISPTTDLRLHEPQQISLASKILERSNNDSLSLQTTLNELTQIWSIRFRLFINSQQQSTYFSTPERKNDLLKSKNILSFGENDPNDSKRTQLNRVINFMELRAQNQGLILLSSFFPNNENQSPSKVIPFTMQSWHDVVIQHTGKRMDLAVDGKLMHSVNTATSNNTSLSKLSPESTFFFFGSSSFHGVISNCAITFNHEITSTNFDHDSLTDRS